MAMRFTDRFLAVDWGTTNRRVFVIEDSLVIETARDGLGVTAVSDFAAEAEAIRARFGDLPMLMAGMVGSTIGWREAPYVPAPAGGRRGRYANDNYSPPHRVQPSANP